MWFRNTWWLCTETLTSWTINPLRRRTTHERRQWLVNWVGVYYYAKSFFRIGGAWIGNMKPAEGWRKKTSTRNNDDRDPYFLKTQFSAFTRISSICGQSSFKHEHPTPTVDTKIMRTILILGSVPLLVKLKQGRGDGSWRTIGDKCRDSSQHLQFKLFQILFHNNACKM